MSGTDFTTTPNLGLLKPIYRKAPGLWGEYWNNNADTLDTALGTGPSGVFLPLAGGKMRGALLLYGPPVGGSEAATKDYVDTKSPFGGPYLPTSGGIMTGPLTVGNGTGALALTFDGAAATANKGLNWRNAGINRWRMITDASDNLGLYAYDAAGAFLDTGLLFRQSDKTATFNFGLRGNNTNATTANGITGVWFQATNTGSNDANGHKFNYFSSANAVGFDIGLVNIATFNPPSLSGGQFVSQASWNVCISPNNPTGFFAAAVAEWNIVNRGADRGWMRDRASGLPPTGGLLIVPEANILGAPGGGEGKNATYAFSTAGSAATNSTGFRVKFYNNYLVEPNSTVGLTGRAFYATGDITGVASQRPYGPFQTEGTWLHGIDTTLATFMDANATTMLAGQGVAWLTGTTGTPTNICRDTAGTGSPEGVVTANKGSTYRRFDGAAGTCFYVKESGTGNTGWVAK